MESPAWDRLLRARCSASLSSMDRPSMQYPPIRSLIRGKLRAVSIVCMCNREPATQSAETAPGRPARAAWPWRWADPDVAVAGTVASDIV